jgi:renalase
MHIAIIGAGIGGLTCATELQARGHSVVVYEISEGVGGRMATRDTELGGFDHGAQYFTAKDERFRKTVAGWQKAGWVERWEGRLAHLDHGNAKPASRGGARFVAVPGMRALAAQLAADIDIRYGQQAMRLERHHGQWLLAVRSDTVPIDASAGPFDIVVVATPADQARPLLQRVPDFAHHAEQARLMPCWSLMLGFQDSLQRDYDGAWVQSSRLAWICRDSSKPQRRPGEHWVAHAPAAWSIEHLDDDPERVKEKLLKAFHDATGTHVQPVYAQVHRWRFAQAVTPVEGDCLWDATLRIGACGDWFAAGLEGAGRIENAFLSATALAAAVE